VSVEVTTATRLVVLELMANSKRLICRRLLIVATVHGFICPMLQSPMLADVNNMSVDEVLLIHFDIIPVASLFLFI
jgi:hypothetical protein